jgi:hypothetical protein
VLAVIKHKLEKEDLCPHFRSGKLPTYAVLARTPQLRLSLADISCKFVEEISIWNASAVKEH